MVILPLYFFTQLIDCLAEFKIVKKCEGFWGDESFDCTCFIGGRFIIKNIEPGPDLDAFLVGDFSKEKSFEERLETCNIFV